MSRQPTAADPRDQGPKPPFPPQEQKPVGSERKMEPAPDYGELSYRGHGRMKGKVALITGGDSGIGRAVALAFVREGADVLISYLDEHADAQQTVAVCEKEEGRRCVAVPGDLADPAHCAALVDRCVSEFGGLDMLVNNAAYQMTFGTVKDVSAEELEQTFKVNILAMFHLSKHALEHIPPGGAIINTTSIQAYQPASILLPYSTTKGAILTFTKGLAEEAIKQGVRVNAVAPGPVWTPLIPYSFKAEDVAQFGADTPIGRPAQPAELAPAYVFLATPDSSYIIGERIGVTGGKPLP